MTKSAGTVVFTPPSGWRASPVGQKSLSKPTTHQSLSTLPPCDFARDEGVLGALPRTFFRIPRSGPQSFPALRRESRPSEPPFQKTAGRVPVLVSPLRH